MPIPWPESRCSLSGGTRIHSPPLESTRFSQQGNDIRLVEKFSIDMNLGGIVGGSVCPCLAAIGCAEYDAKCSDEENR